MILIPQSVLNDCHSVFRRAGPRSSIARSSVNIHVWGGRDGIRLGLVQADVSVQYHHPPPSDSFSFMLPLAALADCQGRGKGTLEFQPAKAGKIEVRWEQAGTPHRREYASRETPDRPFPIWPSHDSVNDPRLLESLVEAMEIPTGAPALKSMQCLQLRGKQGDVVATDGRQLLILGGFQFPWKDSVLVPRTTVFAAKEIARGEVVRVAQSKTHVFIRIGGWTVALAIETAVRFPNVDQVIPKVDLVTTRWHIGGDEGPALAAMLDRLPAAREEQAPVTLDLAAHVIVRARAEEEKRCTDVVLPGSQREGKPARIATDRQFLQRALRLGFRSFQFTDPEKPVLCREGNRV